MTIYILCPDTQQPIGGIKIIYQQIDILNQLGFKAFVLHTINGFRCQWFNNNTPIAYFNQVKIEPTDLVWVSENAVASKFKSLASTERTYRMLSGTYKYKHSIIDIWGIECRKWVFNQNAYSTFDNLGKPLSQPLISSFYEGIEAIICVSENNKTYLKTVFPQVKIERIHLGLNEAQMFSYASPSDKEKVIAYMPRKNADHIQRVLPLLFQIPSIKNGDWILKPLDGLPYNQIATELKKAAIFLSFGYPEGFSMPPAEALISGCLLVGYHGEGGEEYFPSHSKFSVPFGAITEYAQKVSAAIDYWENDKEVADFTKALSVQIASTYNEAENKKDLQRISQLF
jgi:hypothetical protein